MADHLEELTAAVNALPELYQPVFGHEVVGAKPRRYNCEERLVDVKKVYDALSEKLQRPLRVLDLGCAQGFFSFHVAKWGGVVTGVDFGKQNITLCRLLAQEHPDYQVNFVHSSIEDFLPTVNEDEYDLVFAFSVLHWCAKFSGFQFIQAQLKDFAQKVNTGLFEFAIDDIEYLPKNYRDFIVGYSFIRVIFYHEHFGGGKRPLCFASNKYAYFENLGLLDIDHTAEHNYPSGTKIFYCGDKFVKYFDGWNSFQLKRAQIEIQFLHELGGQNGLPKLYVSVKEEDSTGTRFFVVRDFIPGQLLEEIMPADNKIEPEDILEQALKWMIFFEQNKYYYGDLSTGNFILKEDGKIVPIDYEDMSRTPFIFNWPQDARLRFLWFINSLFGKEEGYSFRRYSNLIRLKSYVTERQYEQIKAIKDSEKFFQRLYEILFEPEKETSTYNVEELEFLAMERYLHDAGQRIQELTDTVINQQARIERLERIIQEKFK